MRHRVAGRKLSRPSAQRQAMLRNLVGDLVRHERITTTEAKAKEARSFAEKMITHGKVGSLHHRRLALSALPNQTVVKRIFDDLAPRYADRQGGYTRIIHLGRRKGDGASMAMLELV